MHINHPSKNDPNSYKISSWCEYFCRISEMMLPHHSYASSFSTYPPVIKRGLLENPAFSSIIVPAVTSVRPEIFHPAALDYQKVIPLIVIQLLLLGSFINPIVNPINYHYIII
jgi:hypothetical protein